VRAIPLRKDIASEGLACTASGWGLLDYNKQTKTQILQVVALPFIPHDICRHIYRNYTEGSIEAGMNCAGYLDGGKDACSVSAASLFPSYSTSPYKCQVSTFSIFVNMDVLVPC
jgi:hypothetical protein